MSEQNPSTKTPGTTFETRFAFAIEVAKLVTPKPSSIPAFLICVEQAYEKLGETMQKCKESTRNVEK